MKKIILTAVIGLAVAASGCGKAKEPQKVSEKSGAVGPFDLVVSGENEEKPNAFSASVNQAEGKVDFYLPSGDSVQYLELLSFSATVTGCNANGVQAVPVWYSSESLERGDILQSGATMMTTPRSRSRLTMVFRGMSGCTQLNFSMVVRRLSVGPTQPAIDSRLNGSWSFGTSPGPTISLFAGATRLGWLESSGSRYTCDTTLYPSTSVEPWGGWLVLGGASMVCRYQFSGDKEIVLDCHGRNTYGCTVPKNARFLKQ